MGSERKQKTPKILYLYTGKLTISKHLFLPNEGQIKTHIKEEEKRNVRNAEKTAEFIFSISKMSV